MPRSIRPAVVIILLVVLVLFASIVYLFFRMGSNDARVLSEFPAAYLRYDQAIAACSTAVTSPDPQSAGDLQRGAGNALADLKRQSSARLSSLTRHDGDRMALAEEIGSLSQKEFDTLAAYRQAGGRPTLAQFRHQRQADYDHYRALSGNQN